MTAPARRRVLVTGASRGIGRAVAHAFADSGARVAVHYGTSRDAARDAVTSMPGSGHVMVPGDLAEPDEARLVVEQTIDALGGIDVLVNNAAVAPGERNRHRVGTVTYEEWQASWRDMVDVNLLGAANVTFLVATRLIEQGAGGSIVNVGSRGAFRGEPDFPAYGASKAALHAFGQSMAVALAPHGITVASVAPGVVGTERQLAMLSSPDGQTVRDQSPFGRVATPEEVAAAVLFLASPAAAWSSGAVLDLNGASYLR